MKKIMAICVVVGLSFATTSYSDILLDADTPDTGSLLGTQPLVTPYGTITFDGEMRDRNGDPEFNAAGALGNVFDIHNHPISTAELSFDFYVDSVTFIYGGNAGSILVEARDADGVVVDDFYQADTWDGQPAGPVTLSGVGIRSLYWEDPGGNFAPLDNITISPTLQVSIDIKPGSFPSSVNLKSKGVTPVAIHTTDTFDATEVDPLSVMLGFCAIPINWEQYDCDELPNPLADPGNPDYDPEAPEMIGDGDIDLVLYFKTRDLDCLGDVTEATLTGTTFGGVNIIGTGDISFVNNKK